MLRKAVVADLPAITIVRTAVRENHLSVAQMAARGITPESIIEDIKAGHLGAWVSEIDNRIVAFAMADKRNGNLFALFTHPDHEGQGHGSMLLNEAEAWLANQGCQQAILDTDRNARAVAFYVERGWQEYERDAKDIFMCKDLTPINYPTPSPQCGQG